MKLVYNKSTKTFSRAKKLSELTGDDLKKYADTLRKKIYKAAGYDSEKEVRSVPGEFRVFVMGNDLVIADHRISSERDIKFATESTKKRLEVESSRLEDYKSDLKQIQDDCKKYKFTSKQDKDRMDEITDLIKHTSKFISVLKVVLDIVQKLKY